MNAPQKFVIAVDGGQSSTLALVATLEGRIIGAGFAGPSNHVHEPGGVERLRTALSQSMTEALSNAHQSADNIVSICLGMTGGAEMAADMVQPHFPQARLQSYYDSVTALAGASMAQPGVVVIAGTGAVAYGQLADGRSAKAGGWGYIMGDEGSGYAVARKALLAVGRARDGRGDATALTEALLAHSPPKSFDELVRWSAAAEPGEIATLAPLVLAAAAGGDPVAKGIIEEAATALTELVAPLVALFGGRGQIKLALAGGNLAPDRGLRAPVLARLSRWRDPASAGRRVRAAP